MIEMPVGDSGSIALDKEAEAMKDLIDLTLFIMMFFDRVRYHPTVPEDERAELIRKIDEMIEMPTEQAVSVFVPFIQVTCEKYGWDKE